MKILVDIRLSLAALQGHNVKSLQISKFALKLHKSIRKHENSDFTIALSMFPNKLRAEIYGHPRQFEFHGERKIVSLMKEKVIQEFKDFKEGVDHYKALKFEIK